MDIFYVIGIIIDTRDSIEAYEKQVNWGDRKVDDFITVILQLPHFVDVNKWIRV